MNAAERFVARLFKLPPPPRVVAEAAPEHRILRPSIRYLRRRQLRWVVNQIAAVIGIVLFLSFMASFSGEAPRIVLEELAKEDIEWAESLAEPRLGDWSIWDGLRVLETFGIAFFILQLPISFVMVRLDYLMRWYVLTETSLHIRSGVRDVKNDGDESAEQIEAKMLHVGWLRGLEEAEVARDQILAVVRRHKDAGLGHPESAGPTPESAALELLEEIRALRGAL